MIPTIPTPTSLGTEDHVPETCYPQSYDNNILPSQTLSRSGMSAFNKHLENMANQHDQYDLLDVGWDPDDPLDSLVDHDFFYKDGPEDDENEELNFVPWSRILSDQKSEGWVVPEATCGGGGEGAWSDELFGSSSILDDDDQSDGMVWPLSEDQDLCDMSIYSSDGISFPDMPMYSSDGTPFSDMFVPPNDSTVPLAMMQENLTGPFAPSGPELAPSAFFKNNGREVVEFNIHRLEGTHHNHRESSAVARHYNYLKRRMKSNIREQESERSSPADRYVETTPRPPHWVMEKLECMASEFLKQLAQPGQTPQIVLAASASASLNEYDPVTGVVRRKEVDQSLRSKGGEERMRVRGAQKMSGKSGERCSMAELASDKFTAAGTFIAASRKVSLNKQGFHTMASFFRVADIIHENLMYKSSITKREVYYRDVTLFRRQEAADRIIENLACTLKVPRSSLNVVAGARSVVYGSLRLTLSTRGCDGLNNQGKDNVEFDQSQKVPVWLQKDISTGVFNSQGGLESSPLTRGYSRTDYNTLVHIPIDMDDVLQIELHPQTRHVLVIEKESTMQLLISSGYCETFGPCVLMTSKGYPDRAIRLLLKRISDMIDRGVLFKNFKEPSPTLYSPLPIPLLALVDCDPNGIEIYLTYKFGSAQSAYDNANLAAPNLKCIGQIPSDWALHTSKSKEDDTSSVEECIEDRNRLDQFQRSLLTLTARDRAKLFKMLKSQPFIRGSEEWQREIGRMLWMNRKSELQSLCLALAGCNLDSGVSPGSHPMGAFVGRKLQDPRKWI